MDSEGYILNDAGEPGLNLPETEEALAYHKKFVDLMPGKPSTPQ